VKAFTRTTGGVAVLDRADVDTDQIIPKQFLKRIERTGYGEFLFYDWRKDPAFELNRPEYAGATILVTGRNFGCGSSREHAAWALQDHGFEVVPEAVVRQLIAAAELTVDLEALTITPPRGRPIAFEFDSFRRHKLLHGLDDIGLTLQHEAEIAAFESTRPGRVETTSLPA
jgi:3-isopropylmalate/(R)-2-methylmalate dehydratase small subunit